MNMTRILATEADLKALDLYSDLLLLPKNVEAEGEDRTQDISEIAVSDAAATVDGGSNEKGMSKRELGRLKHKKALQYLQEGICGESLDVGEECKRLKSPQI
jgi:tRNA (guanine-N(7)-)-methyltransferase subunit TRM82